jgi:hypothetical protein
MLGWSQRLTPPSGDQDPVQPVQGQLARRHRCHRDLGQLERHVLGHQGSDPLCRLVARSCLAIELLPMFSIRRHPDPSAVGAIR